MYRNEALQFEISLIDDYNHNQFGKCFYTFYGIFYGDYGYISPTIGKYIIQKITTLDDGSKWYEMDKIVWNLLDILTEKY